MAQTTVRRLLGFLAETPIHAGIGSQLGAVDLPIQRERHTEWPTIYGTGLKGVFRDHAESENDFKNFVSVLFGPDTEKREGTREAERHAGALAFSDARLLLLPVRSAGRAFAWVTCPLALARLRRDAADAHLSPPLPDLTDQPDENRVLVSESVTDQRILLEEFDFQANRSSEVSQIAKWIGEKLFPSDPVYKYWRKDLLPNCLFVCTDDDFKDFCKSATEIATRVKLTATKTVETGALWTEESLPAESLLYSLCVAWPPRKDGSSLENAGDVMEKFAALIRSRRVFQFGGKETTGRGFAAVTIAGGNHG